MNTKPSDGAIMAAEACYKAEVAVLDPGYYPGEAEIEFNIAKAASIIDRYPNAIADKLAVLLKRYLDEETGDSDLYSATREALERYNEGKRPFLSP